MLVVAAAMMAPVSSKAWSFRHKAERKTARSAKDGSAQVLAQARHPSNRVLQHALYARERIDFRGRMRAQDEVSRLVQPEELTAEDEGRRHIGPQVQADGAAEHIEAMGRFEDDRSGTAVVRSWIEPHAELRGARTGHDEAVELDRCVDAQSGWDPRSVIEDVERAIGGRDVRAEHVGVGHVLGMASRPLGWLEAESASLLAVENTGKDRRAVEARQAQPLDVCVGGDERQHSSVADHTVVERRYRF